MSLQIRLLIPVLILLLSAEGALGVVLYEFQQRYLLFIIIVAVISIILAVAVIPLVIRRMVVSHLEILAQEMVEVSQGDLVLQNKLAVERADIIGYVLRSFVTMVDHLKEIMIKVNHSSQQVARTSEQLSANAEETNRSTKLISQSIQQVAAGVEKQALSATNATQVVSDISKGMDKVSISIQLVAELTVSANEKASVGNQVATETVTQMNLVQEKVGSTSLAVNILGEKSKEIGQIVALITQISNQTNLLALNAAIEAARAGEHGRGFTVVADEVRKLADQSSNAASKIRELIEEIQLEASNVVQTMNDGSLAVSKGIEMVRDTGHAFREIVNTIEEVSAQSQEVSAIVEEVNAGTQSMVEMMESVAHVAKNSSGNTFEVAASAQQQSSTMDEMYKSTDSLSKMAADLQEVINQFKL